MSRYFKATITGNWPLQKNHYLLSFSPRCTVREPEPGQFYMIGIEGDYDPLLKRPFCLLRKTEEGFQILYRIKGRGTSLLRNLGSGAVIDVVGPLGNPYPLPSEHQTPLIVAGGIGMASLFSLAERLAGKSYIFYGARTGEELLLLDEVRGLARELFISTDDGSLGSKGTAIDLLRDFLESRSLRGNGIVAYACGQRAMLGALQTIARDSGIATYVSMEENMACGIGACLGCVVKTVRGHQRVCKEGPVFPIDEIIFG